MFNYTAIVTSFNSEKTITASLDSVSNQLIPPSQVILVDDYSSDHTIELASRFLETLNNFQIVVNDANLGQSAGRNMAAELANSDYLMFFDDDDESLDSRSLTHASHFSRGADISFVSSIKNYPNGYRIKCLDKELDLSPTTTDLVKYLLLGVESSSIQKVFIPASTCAITKAAFHKTGGFDVNFRRLEDVDLAIKCASANFMFSWTSEIGVTRSFTENSTKGHGVDMLFEEKLLHKYKDVLKPQEYVNALTHTQARRLYFSRSYFQLVLHLIRNPKYSVKSCSRVKKLLSRVVHDLRKI